ncbi:Phytochrome-like protein cph2 [compost metagenome]
MVLPGTSAGGARLLAEKVRRSIEALAIPHDMPVPRSVLSASIGVATLTPKAGQACLVLVDMADQGLYQAKNNGRNQVAMVVPDPAP